MKPLIQIEDEVREMTDAEFEIYKKMLVSAEPVNLATETTQE